MSITITLLGEMSAQVDGQVVDIGPARQRCVLAALSVDAGRLVPADQLVRRVWGANIPRRGPATLHSHISRLRGAFAGALTIVHRSDGYTLAIDQPDQAVDLLQFRALRDQARHAKDDTAKVTLLSEALALWQGEPLPGLSGHWVDSTRDQWQQERWAAELDLVDAQLHTGQGEDLVPSLSARTAQCPLDERVAAQYMLALHRAGRTAHALDHYRQLRNRLIEELGTDPRTPLRNLHQQILTADPSLIPATADTVTQPVVIPQQLPAAPAPFVGRQDELDRLDSTLFTNAPHMQYTRNAESHSTLDETPGGGMTVISAIGGAGGIGKTWLALHWAHHHLDRFPDGQLFVDLRGFSPDSTPLAPAAAVRGFLDALGVDPGRIPVDAHAQTALLRSLVARKRMLIVLDNAATTDQVTPLLPGGHHCTVVVTSRNHLRGLIARHGAHPVHLDVLTDTESRTLLATALGPDRAAADAPAIAELIELCGGFPLALGLIAARAAADPHLPLREIVAELRNLSLNALDSEDPTASLPAVLSWSLRHLTDQQRQVFALLGIAPGPDTGLPAASALTGLPERETHMVLQALADASLIDRTPGGRYAMHDLVRAYATTIADDLPVQVRESALRRVLDLYTATAHAAARLLEPHHDSALSDLPDPGGHPLPLPDVTAALAWFDTEHACLLAGHHTATTLAWHSTVWHLTWGLDTFHFRRGHRHDRLIMWQAAADATTHLPDPTTHTRALRQLGLTHADLGHHEDALDNLHQALVLAESHHDTAQQAHTHGALGWVWGRRGDDRQALEHARRALDLYRGLDQPVGEARALNAVGWCAARLGDYDTARTHCQAALTLHRYLHNSDGEAATLDSLGYIDYHSGRHHQSLDHYHQALTLVRGLGDTYDAANVLEALGYPHAALGQHEQALTAWREALKLYQQQGRHDHATRIQTQLDNLDSHDQDDHSSGPQRTEGKSPIT